MKNTHKNKIILTLLCLLFFTTHQKQTQAAESVWSYEGVSWYTVPTTESGSTIVYRFWSAQYQSHFFTASEEEKNLVINNYDDHVWKYEGIAYYIYPSQNGQSPG